MSSVFKKKYLILPMAIGLFLASAVFSSAKETRADSEGSESVPTLISATYDYDGTPKGLICENTPSGYTCEVEYYSDPWHINQVYDPTDAGEYYAWGVFVDALGERVDMDPLEATLTINKAYYDMTGVIFEDQTYEYNGEPYALSVSNIPEGVTLVDVKYYTDARCSEEFAGMPTEIGIYYAIATFSGDSNHHPIIDLWATLTITEATPTPTPPAPPTPPEPTPGPTDSTPEPIAKSPEVKQTSNSYIYAFAAFGGYTGFVIIYNWIFKAEEKFFDILEKTEDKDPGFKFHYVPMILTGLAGIALILVSIFTDSTVGIISDVLLGLSLLFGVLSFLAKDLMKKFAKKIFVKPFKNFFKKLKHKN